jgi:lysozyme family protein
MADFSLFAPFVFRWEGGFSNDPADRGKATNMGVTLSTWQRVGYDKDGDQQVGLSDLRLLTPADVAIVMKRYYWDRWQADHIDDQSVAEILVDWVWCSGKWGIVIPQRLLRVAPDGVVGNITLRAVNTANPAKFHARILNARIKFINDIIRRDPTQARFKNGWMRRSYEL